MLTETQIREAKGRAKREVARDAGRLLARYGPDSLAYGNAHADAHRMALVFDYYDPPIVRLFGHDYAAMSVDLTGQVHYRIVPCETCESCCTRFTEGETE